MLDWPYAGRPAPAISTVLKRCGEDKTACDAPRASKPSNKMANARVMCRIEPLLSPAVRAFTLPSDSAVWFNTPPTSLPGVRYAHRDVDIQGACRHLQVSVDRHDQ